MSIHQTGRSVTGGRLNALRTLQLVAPTTTTPTEPAPTPTPTVTVPAAPTNLVARTASKSQISLTWTDNATNETGFKIERSLDGGRSWTQIGTVGANVTSVSNTGLARRTTYYYRIRAYNSAGDSTYSAIVSARTF